MKRSLIWSYGGGVQTIAILTLIAEGRLPRPELAIIADTGRERSSTWRYLDLYARPILKNLQIPLEIVSHELAKVDLYGHNGDLLLPVYTQTGKLPTFCSEEWKKLVVWRRLRELGYSPRKPVLVWLGYSLNEVHRMREADKKWVKNHWPLILDFPLRQHECVLQIERFGLPEPSKSACWMCPHLINEEWQDIRQQDPKDFRQAVLLDYQIREKDKQKGVYLHQDRIPLDQADLSILPKPAPLFECSDSCWT